MLFAAVGNNSAANEINCAHTDNCMEGGQNKREWQSFLQFASRGYTNIYMQSCSKSIFRFMIENIAHTPQ